MTLPLPPTIAVAAAEHLQQALLLGGLLTKRLKHLADPAVAIAARPIIESATCAALPPPAAAHGRWGGVMRGDEVGGGRNPE